MTIYDMVKRNAENLVDFFESRYALDRKSASELSGSDIIDQAVNTIISDLTNGTLYHHRFSDSIGTKMKPLFIRLLFVDSDGKYVHFNVHKYNWTNVCEHFLGVYSRSFVAPLLYGDTLFLIFTDDKCVLGKGLSKRLTDRIVFCSSYSFRANESTYSIHVSLDKQRKSLYVVREADDAC